MPMNDSAASAAIAAGTRNVACTSITGSVKTKLIKDDHVDGLNINVDTHAGVVTLNGHVESAGDAKRAVGLARSVKGVEKVVSKLVVLSD